MLLGARGTARSASAVARVATGPKGLLLSFPAHRPAVGCSRRSPPTSGRGDPHAPLRGRVTLGRGGGVLFFARAGSRRWRGVSRGGGEPTSNPHGWCGRENNAPEARAS